jgi:hypothetical protein
MFKRHFAEFHMMISAINHLDKLENQLAYAESDIFGEEFGKYAQLQKGAFESSLNELIDTGSQHVTLTKRNLNTVRSLPDDLQPLLTMETEIAKWRSLAEAAKAEAESRKQAVVKAETDLARTRPRGKEIDVKKAEAALSAAQRAADDAVHSYEDQRAHLEREEEPYKERFAKGFVDTLARSFDVRCGTAEMRCIIANQFLSVVDGFTDYDDPTLVVFKQRLQTYEDVKIE